MTLVEAAAALRSRKASSAELTEECLARIGRENPRLNAFLTVTGDLARSQAAASDRELAEGVDRGPLHGIPVALKDLFFTAGIRTTCGSALFADQVPEYDAAVVEKLNEAGAVLLGKTTMHELALGITSNNPHFGAVRNPWDTGSIPGGSSGGSGSAVAAGLCYMAMGSDTGGSIRIPASYCGVVGLKSTFGLVSGYGAMPLGLSLDHMGPLTRTVRDAAVALNAIAGFDPRDENSARRPAQDYVPPAECPIRGLRIGWPGAFYFDRVTPEAVEAVRHMARAAESLGACVANVELPDMEAINAIGRIILHAEASALMEPYLTDRRHLMGEDVLALFDQGRFLRATDYVNAQRLRRLARDAFARVWEKVDCLFTPAAPMGAPLIGQTTVTIQGREEDVRLATTRLVRGINVLGLPAISIPCGLDPRGMPLGLQIVAPPFAEASLLRVAAALEDAFPFHGLEVM